MTKFTYFFLDHEKDIIVNLYRDLDRLYYELQTPNHATGNLIRNLARVCDLPISEGADGKMVIRGEVPCYLDGNNREIFIFRMGNTKVANIYPDGRVEMKASIPAIAKTLMSQTKDYRLDISRTIFKTYIPRDLKFHSDLHTHMNGNLAPDILIALGIVHQIRYPLYYIKKLKLALTVEQKAGLESRRVRVARQFVTSGLKGKYLDRKIDDNTFINFADLIMRNLDHAEENIVRIRASLAVLKDGQAVFTNLEKVYLYRYVFCKGMESEEKIRLRSPSVIPDNSISSAVSQMLKDKENPAYRNNTIFQDKLLWIARSYAAQGITYAEISDTTLVKRYESVQMLEEVHAVLPAVYAETGVRLRFLAAMRRIPLTIVRDQITPEDYLAQNLSVLAAVAADPYVAGCDFVGEEINDIIDLKPVFPAICRIAAKFPGFTIRIHAGENDSLKDNISHSITCVRDSLAPGQPMPKMRIGHGLYTYSLSSKKGAQVLEELRKNHVVLEFQLTSNIRLNNLSSTDIHPLRQYLSEGIACVQGTDGSALYGTTPIDEQLSLEKLLNLTPADFAQMKAAETAIIQAGEKDFQEKSKAFETLLNGRSMDKVLLGLMDEAMPDPLRLGKRRKLDAGIELDSQIHELPWDRLPIILAGGSFNTEHRVTRVTDAGRKQLDDLLSVLSPEDVFFVIGHRLQGYERYLLDHNEKGFRIFAVVPSRLTAQEAALLQESGVSIRISPESEGMGIYKSFNYEIFERRPCIVIAFDGNSAGANLIQEARNGKGKAILFVWEDAGVLRKKAVSLEGYIHFFNESDPLAVQTKNFLQTVVAHLSDAPV